MVKKLNEELIKILNEEAIDDEVVEGNNNDNGNDFDDDIYLQSILFKNETIEDLKDFKELIEKEGIMTQLFVFNGQYNTFKKCPHCKQIWFLYSGCPNTVCGNRTTIRDLYNGIFKNYKVSFDGEKIVITNEQKENKYDNKDFQGQSLNYGLTPKETEENKTRPQNKKALIKPAGCGASLNWTTCEDATEEAMKILNEISLDDYFSFIG